MALRFLLVSLVAGLGIDPPSLPEVTAWANSGREWVQARLMDITGARVVADREQADAEFDDVVASMAEQFSVDLAEIDRPKSKAQIAFEPIDVPEQLDAGIAYSLNRSSQGEGDSTTVVSPSHELAGSLAGPAHGSVPTASSGESCRTCRLASAVRLTRQAALAWMTLLHDTDQPSVHY